MKRKIDKIKVRSCCCRLSRKIVQRRGWFYQKFIIVCFNLKLNKNITSYTVYHNISIHNYRLRHIHPTYILKDNHDDVLKTRYLKKRQKLLWPLSAFIIIWYIAFLNEGTWTIDKERKLVSGKLLFRSQERTKLYGTILTTTTTMLRKKLTAFPRVFTNTHFSLRIQSINRVTN